MIKPGIYKHYKGNYYEVFGTGLDAETLQQVVLYRALYANKQSTLWTKPLYIFASNIDHNIPRYQYCETINDLKEGAD